jgi:hypothetical protein
MYIDINIHFFIYNQIIFINFQIIYTAQLQLVWAFILPCYRFAVPGVAWSSHTAAFWPSGATPDPAQMGSGSPHSTVEEVKGFINTYLKIIN